MHIQTAPDAAIDVKPLADNIFGHLQARFDVTHGGFGGAPKFPSPSQTTHFLSRYAAYHLSNADASDEERKAAEQARDMAVFTLTKIYNGGIRDVVGGGFSRYSVDERWHVPHCEYMRSGSMSTSCSHCGSSREDAVGVRGSCDPTKYDY